MVMQAFVDEAGNSDANPYFVMFGLIGETSAWSEFSAEWQSLLSEPPRMRVFKMSNAHRMPEGRLRKFVQAVDRYAFTGVPCVAPFKDFESVFGAYKSAGYIFRHPYALAYQRMIVAIAESLWQRGHSERIELIFDRQDTYGPRIKQSYPLLRASAERYEAILPIEPRFETDEEFLPLQASDLMAGAWRRTLESSAPQFEWIQSEMKDTRFFAEDTQVLTESVLRHMLAPGPDITEKPITPEEAAAADALRGKKL